MKSIFFLVTFILLIISGVFAQKHKLMIPELRNVFPNDINPEPSLISAYAGKFDILISLERFNNRVAFEQKTKVLAHKENGWYKMNISSGYIYSDTTTVKIQIIKMDNAIGDTLWNILTGNHFFDMHDERAKTPLACSTTIFDAGEYEFEIITVGKYKKLYFYAPDFYEEHCPGVIERKQVLNCLKAFEKYLGK